MSAHHDSMHSPGQSERQARLAREATILVGANRVATTACVVLIIVIVGLLVLLRGGGGRPQQQGAEPIASSPTLAADTTIRTSVVRDEIVARPYAWVIDGERTDRTPRLSPDGQWAAWLPQGVEDNVAVNRIIVRNLDSGVEQDLTPDPGFGYSSVQWSPDSRALAFVKYRREEGKVMPSELWRIDADGSNLQQLYRNDRSSPGAGGPSFGISAWSNDGQHIALGGTIWGHPAAGMMTWIGADGTGVARTIPRLTAAECGATDDTRVDQTQLVAPAADYVLCVVKTAGLLQSSVSAPAGGDSLVLYDVMAQHVQVLVSMPGRIELGSVAPDGEWIAFSSGRLWVVRRDGIGLQAIEGDTYERVQRSLPVWSDAGRAYFIALPSQSNNQATGYLYELDAASGTARVVTMDWRVRTVGSVSRDGRRLLLVRGNPNSPEKGGIWRDAEIHLVELQTEEKAE